MPIKPETRLVKDAEDKGDKGFSFNGIEYRTD